MQPEARVVADSISPQGVRLTSIQVTMHRWVLAEANTHRVLSRNSASSRAIPVGKQLSRIERDPAEPLEWASEQRGMQGGPELTGDALSEAKRIWRANRMQTLDATRQLAGLGLHKSLSNRLIEPHSDHVCLITATAWENFFAQRLDADAQPEIRIAAEAMKAAMDASTPTPLVEGQWHLPYVDGADLHIIRGNYAMGFLSEEEVDQKTAAAATKISAAHCARVSYLTQEGKRDLNEDLRLYDRLTKERSDVGKPLHWSPLEHVATPWDWNRQEGCIHFGQDLDLVGVEDTFTCVPLDHLPRTGNLLGWRSLRTEVEASMHERTYR